MSALQEILRGRARSRRTGIVLWWRNERKVRYEIPQEVWKLNAALSERTVMLPGG